MTKTIAILAGSILVAAPSWSEPAAETAAAFGTREGVQQVSLSPAGDQIAFLAPAAGSGTTLYTMKVAQGATPKAALATSGKPDYLTGCRWVSDTRLICSLQGLAKAPDFTLPLGYSRLIAVDAGGGNQKMLNEKKFNGAATQFGGSVVDWLPGQDGDVLLSRYYTRTDAIGTISGSDRQGLGIDRLNTRTGMQRPVETPRADAIEYITDGHGEVRVAGFRQMSGTGYERAGISYRYRSPGSHEWKVLGVYDAVSDTGFNPYRVDAAQNVVYGTDRVNGRSAFYKLALDGSGTRTPVLTRDDVDVDGLATVGRGRRVIGASYATDVRHIVYFDQDMAALAAALGRALPKTPLIDIVDASEDESKLLILAASDDDPGRYYVFDRKAKTLTILLAVRPQLEGRRLANVKPISYHAADGTIIPAYLTLPPGGPQKGLPAIVMPHGGPSARDEWGFDWLSQYFAARGYAVIQPNYRGSKGYGDDFYKKNGFRSWRTAIGDVNDAGHWLVREGLADPNKLVIFGWSYGGYAALQTSVLEPGLFKAIVAVAPVTDLLTLKEESRDFVSYRVNSDFIGSGNLLVEGSPAQNAARIKAPVLLVHGTLDSNVAYAESTLMAAKLRAAGGKVELMTFDGLAHSLDDSTARAKLLERSDAFIRTAIGG